MWEEWGWRGSLVQANLSAILTVSSVSVIDL